LKEKIRDAIGNIADVIRKVGQDGKEHVIIKKSCVEKLSPIPEKPVVTPEKEDTEDIAKLVAMRMKDWKKK
jgi:hypothetical protein